jgi:hypothetical protein
LYQIPLFMSMDLLFLSHLLLSTKNAFLVKMEYTGKIEGMMLYGSSTGQTSQVAG